MRTMNSATLRLVLLVSCCHALVHVYEHSLASVEQLLVGDEAFAIEPGKQQEVSGELGNCLRLPFGLCALAAGWLADRFGSKRLLLVYLIGCSVAAALAWWAPNLLLITVAMFALGVFCGIYHPAGVSLITHHTTPENRPMALGYHGVLGSAGIAAGPFVAGVVLTTGATWRHYYLVLSVPGLVLAGWLLWRLVDGQRSTSDDRTVAGNGGSRNADDAVYWPSYFTLMAMTAFAGFVYAAIFHFLPRYLAEATLPPGQTEISEKVLAMGNYRAAFVLLLGVIGQYTAGRIARPATLEPLMALAFFLAVPCVVWMGFASGVQCLLAAALFSPLFFMHQPLFNSLVAKYVPRQRRSLCYGLSFTIGFGVGSLGPNFAGRITDYPLRFSVLAGALTVAAVLSLILWRWHGPVEDDALT
ncbi:MAG: MFS transporter [Candidatus Nealsonbacteria bacterium]|nr:MFS transporter [Candidatus Nealsonbacteria bacterium]